MTNKFWSHRWLTSWLLTTLLFPCSCWLSSPESVFQRRFYRFSVARNHDESVMDLNLLLLDHYDSYTYNLYDQVAQHCQKPPLVLPKDVASTWSELEVLLRDTYNISQLDGVILSPGPGRPTVNDLGADIIRCNPNIPILGVCLGHQLLAVTYFNSDDAVICAPLGPVHGHVHLIHPKENCPLFRGVSRPFPATRYHSLVVQIPSLPDTTMQPLPLLETTAVFYDPLTQQPVIMGLAHTSNPHYGVQFHPESIGTQPHGHVITQNFLQICQDYQQQWQQLNRRKQYSSLQPSRLVSRPILPIQSSSLPSGAVAASRGQDRQVFVYKVPNLSRHLCPQDVFDSHMANEPYSVWLDGTNHHQPTQCSILTSYRAKEDGGYRVEYFGQEHEEHLRGLYLYRPHSHDDNVLNGDSNEVLEWYPDQDILSFLKDEHAHTSTHVNMITSPGGVNGAAWRNPTIQRMTEADTKQHLPFDFRGGHVGYLGYEVRHDVERRMGMPSRIHELHNGSHKRKPQCNGDSSPYDASSPNGVKEKAAVVPTAAFLFAHQSLVYDPNQHEWYLVGVLDPSSSTKRETLFQWFKSTEAELHRLSCNQSKEQRDHQPPQSAARMASNSPTQFNTLRSKATYQQDIAACHEFIRLGESYELCLTNQLVANILNRDNQKTSWRLYQILRRRNPAPFSAYFNWNSQQQQVVAGRNGDQQVISNLAICCSSPERFVSVKRQAHENGNTDNNVLQPTFTVEAKPIKGTCARVQPTFGNTKLTTVELREDMRRAQELQSSIKNRAENLMIVDLLRNDLSRVCRIGSVHVPKLMHVESYTTVHQLVSTIRGQLDNDRNAIDVLEACFPGGSMTGAPKLRTLELLDELEQGNNRGPYSGCLGYISLNGSMDMNIIIRTAVLTPHGADGWKVSVGAGGAITALSDCDDEYDEMLLKAKAVMEAVQEWDDAANQLITGTAAETAPQLQKLQQSFATRASTHCVESP